MLTIGREVLFALYVCVCLLLLEAWHRSSLVLAFHWITERPYVFFLNFLILFSLVLLLLASTGRRRVSLWVVTIGMLLLFTVSRVKMKLKGEPLLPWDVFLGNEAANIREYFVLLNRSEIVVLLLLFIMLAASPLLFSKNKVTSNVRIIIAVAPIIVFSLLYFEKPISLLELGEVNDVFWDQSITYQRNGVQVGFINTLQLLNIDPPPDYSKGTIQALMDDLKTSETNQQKPNIIMVMNEAFWDPTRLPNLEFSEDPLPHFRHLQDRYISGELIVPVFGGSTANTEFEVLTGNSMQFLPQGSIPYSQYVLRPHPSIASILRNEGYRTIAIHNYHNWFYRRDQVYEFLGFDQFISQSFFENPEYRRDFISDREMAKQIIKEHQRAKDPLFVFAVTMQNHGPYNARHYQEDRITVSGDVGEDMLKVVSTYTTGVKDADDSLQMLVDYFDKTVEPTIVVFFGDHLPYLGAAYKAYTATGFIEDANPETWDDEDYEKMYGVPFVVWDNFSGTKRKNVKLSSSFLVPFLLDTYQKPQTPLMRLINQVFVKDGKIITGREKMMEVSNEDSTYALMQYDQLFGEMYALGDDERTSITSGHYYVGGQSLLVTDVQVKEEQNLIVHGENFTYKTKVILEGNVLPTSFQSAQQLKAEVPDGFGKDVSIKVAIIDSKNRVLAESNTFTIER